jgi:hypothetical protein
VYREVFFANQPEFFGAVGLHEPHDGTEMHPYRDTAAGAPVQANAGLSLKYGLEYIGKGAKFSGTGINLNYLEIPLDVVYHYPLGEGNLHGGLGPYFAYGVGGSTGGINSYGEQNGGFKRFDAGLNVVVGYTFNNGLAIDLGYDLGLANVEYANQDVTGHTRTLSLNVGYQIGRLFVKKRP